MLPTVFATCIHQVWDHGCGLHQHPWHSLTDSRPLVMNRQLPARKGALQGTGSSAVAHAPIKWALAALWRPKHCRLAAGQGNHWVC